MGSELLRFIRGHVCDVYGEVSSSNLRERSTNLVRRARRLDSMQSVYSTLLKTKVNPWLTRRK